MLRILHALAEAVRDRLMCNCPREGKTQVDLHEFFAPMPPTFVIPSVALGKAKRCEECAQPHSFEFEDLGKKLLRASFGSS
jgi:hypothetical protein